MAVSISEVIARDRAAVWAEMTAWERAPQWMGEVEALDPGDGPVGLGSRLRLRHRGREIEATVVRWVPGKALALRFQRQGVYVNYVYRLEDARSGTHVRFDAECYGGGVRWRVLGPWLRARLRRADGGQLRALKGLAEAR